jgi:hypothetical protein
MGELRHVAKEGAIGLGILREDHRMRSNDHGKAPLS